MSVYNAIALIKDPDRVALDVSVFSAALQQITAAQAEMEKSVQAFHSLLRSASTKPDGGSWTTEWVESEEQLVKRLAAIEEAVEQFFEVQVESSRNAKVAETADSKQLMQAWAALLDGDTATLSKMNTYAENALAVPARQLFFKLVEGAGIAVATDGCGGGWLHGFYRSSMNFEIDGKWLQIGFRHEFDREDLFDSRTYPVGVVGGCSNNGVFQVAGELNTDEAAVKVACTAISEKLRRRYEAAQ